MKDELKTDEELKEILEKHKKWLNDEEGGECANLRHADLQGVDLRDAYLKGADLQDVDLQGADLEGAKLQGADLQGADLQGANLRHADLQHADLRDAKLQDAYLKGADLQGVDLQGADLRSTNLREADLRGANIDFSCLPLWCGGLSFKVDERQAKQLMYHVINIIQNSDIETEKIIKKKTYEWLASSHLVDEHGLSVLKPKEIKR